MTSSPSQYIATGEIPQGLTTIYLITGGAAILGYVLATFIGIKGTLLGILAGMAALLYFEFFRYPQLHLIIGIRSSLVHRLGFRTTFLPISKETQVALTNDRVDISNVSGGKHLLLPMSHFPTIDFHRLAHWLKNEASLDQTSTEPFPEPPAGFVKATFLDHIFQRQKRKLRRFPILIWILLIVLILDLAF